MAPRQGLEGQGGEERGRKTKVAGAVGSGVCCDLGGAESKACASNEWLANQFLLAMCTSPSTKMRRLCANVPDTEDCAWTRNRILRPANASKRVRHRSILRWATLLR
jgi:RNA 3'-terminal phosphate cyclase